MSVSPPVALPDQRVISGPVKQRSELSWRIEQPDGRRLVLAQLLPELARDEALRRRYVHDAERRAALRGEGVAEIVAIGPDPDPRDPEAAAPWRLRIDPDGESLAALLGRRAPLPVDEALELAATLAEVVHEVHEQGAVLRDLEPRHVVVTGDGVVLTDVGLARLEILSSRSASSLMLESSPYAAPEHLRSTIVDSRADIYTIGAIAWQALTGEVPRTDPGSIFRDRAPLPSLESLGVDAPAGLDALLGACLDDNPEARPDSARDVAAALRGETQLGGQLALARVVCQACGQALRPGLRLCLSCGKEAIQFSHAEGDQNRYKVQLIKATEDAEFVARLGRFFETVAEGPVPELDFLTGDARLYSKAERERLHRLPATLIADLDRDTAEALAGRLGDAGFKVKVVEQRPESSTMLNGVLIATGLVAVIGGAAALAMGTAPLGAVLLVGGAAAWIGGMIRTSRRRRAPRALPLATLRRAAAALPASDPLIARLGELLADDLAADVRERVSEIALLVQRLVDHRFDGDSDFARLTEPVEPIVELVEAEVSAIAACDRALVELDEATLVRAIAASEARREPRERRIELYAGLDRLRSLEDQRARHMERLLEASSLMRRITDLGLGVRDEEAAERRLIAMARAALDEGGSAPEP